MIPRALAVLFVVSVGGQAAGQTTALQGAPAVPTPDSAARLNAAGHFADALRAARARIGVASPDEKCSLRIDIMISLERMGLLDGTASEIKTFDPQCAASPAARARAKEVKKIRSEVALPPLPTTGLDFSSVDAFWRVADLLGKDVEPSEDDWRRMMSTVGYRLSIGQVATTRSDMDIALRPSHGAQFDSLTQPKTDQADRLRHMRATVAHRTALGAYRDSVAQSLPVEQAVSIAAKFLPPHATDGKAPPLVAFGIFRDDAYSNGPQGVIIDLDHIYEEGGLTLLLAHEFHHSYLSALSTLREPNRDSTTTLFYALRNMRNEGIADLIDKPYPLSYPNSPLMSAYAKRYNEAYARTPEIIRSIDSALVVAYADSTKLPAVGRRVTELLPSAGHYNGSYVAREIYETFGVDSLYPGVHNFFAFLRTYAAAEKKRGNPPPFSPKAISLLDSLERKYLSP